MKLEDGSGKIDFQLPTSSFQLKEKWKIKKK